MPPPLLGFCLGWFSNCAGSQSGQIQSVKLLIKSTYSHWEVGGGRGELNQREGERGNRGEYWHKAGWKHHHYWMYARNWLQSTTLINTCRKVPLQVNFFTWRHFAIDFFMSYLSTFQIFWKCSVNFLLNWMKVSVSSFFNLICWLLHKPIPLLPRFTEQGKVSNRDTSLKGQSQEHFTIFLKASCLLVSMNKLPPYSKKYY
jgi:hypothetical protein